MSDTPTEDRPQKKPRFEPVDTPPADGSAIQQPKGFTFTAAPGPNVGGLATPAFGGSVGGFGGATGGAGAGWTAATLGGVGWGAATPMMMGAGTATSGGAGGIPRATPNFTGATPALAGGGAGMMGETPAAGLGIPPPSIPTPSPCSRTQEKLDELNKEHRQDPLLWGDYFFKTDDPNKVPKKFSGDTRQLHDESLRCSECGCTIAEHIKDAIIVRRAPKVIQGLYDAVLGATLDTSSGLVHKLTLTGDFCWLTDRDELATIYIRPEVHTALWETLKGQFAANGHLLIKGNPGLGKSWSLNYLLYRCLKENLTQVVVLRSRLGWYVFDTIKKEATFFPPENRFPEELIQQRYLLLHDAGTKDTHDVKLDLGENVFRRATAVLASSPQRKNYQSFENNFRPHKIFIFPPLSRDEFLEVTNTTGISLDERELKFDRYGSSIRNANVEEEVLESKLSAGIKAFNFSKQASAQITEDASSRVLQLVPPEDSGNVQYTKQPALVKFVSRYAENKFWNAQYTQFELTSHVTVFAMLQSIEDRGIYGIPFERYVQKFANRLNWDSPLRNLQASENLSQTPGDLSLQPAKVDLVPPCEPQDIHKTLDSFEKAMNFRWVAPSIGNFPVMDAFLVNKNSLYGVQITISDKHPPTESKLQDLESYGLFLSDSRMQLSQLPKKRRLDGVIFVVDKYRPSVLKVPQRVSAKPLGPAATAWNSCLDKQFRIIVDLKEHEDS